MTKTGPATGMSLDEETLGETLLRYQRPLTIGAVVLAAGVGVGVLMKMSNETKERRGYEALAGAEAVYGSGDAARAHEELSKVVTRYAGTAAGTAAALLSAQLHFESGKVDDGLAVLDRALSKAPSHQKAGLYALRAAGKATAGKPAEAASDYEAAAAAAQFVQEREEYQMLAARQHAAAGNTAAASKIYEAIAGRETSPHAGEARLRLGEVTTKG